MKKKIVLWGLDENENRLLLALELEPRENKVILYSFPENVATEEFYNQLMEKWREGADVEFPETFEKIERPLTVTDELLPDNIRVERGDLISRAKAEWHFVVLSTKLYDLYKSELEEFKERIDRLTEYDGGVFEEMKSFWSKVSEQARDRNLFREHAERLKLQTNGLFDKMKELRSQANAELNKLSKENMARFREQLNIIDEKIEKGLGLKPIFGELKNLQAEFKDTKFTREDRSSLWKDIDAAFKKFKAKKYGDKPADSNQSSRLERRYKGLMSAIEKMEKSIARDEKDIAFQNKRVNETQGQLEMQIRQAKIKMVEERIESKRHKLKDMLQTQIELEARLEKEKERQEKQAAKKEVKEKAEEIKEKIASEINQKAEDMKEEAARLKEAAKAINEGPSKEKSKKTKPGIVESLATEVGEMIEDVVDTVKAVSEVVEDNLENKVDQIKEDLKEKAEEMELDKKLSNIKEKAEKLKESIGEEIEDIGKKIKGDEEE